MKGRHPPPDAPFAERIRHALNAEIVDVRPLHGGCIAAVRKVTLDDGRVAVVKSLDQPGQALRQGSPDEGGPASLEIEGWMLQYLRENSALPVPEVFYASPDLLAMQFLPGESRFSLAAEAHAAELLAGLHGIRHPHFGLERGTLIGGLHQPNDLSDSWLEFFAEQRVLFMAHRAHEEGKLSLALLHRLENCCGQLDRWLEEPEHPSLLHGDAWTTNILAAGDRITGFLDPAVYYGHPEIELAFTTLFGTFGPPFFNRYHELRPIPAGFFELRMDIYNLYPLLVHVRLFGSGYLPGIERMLGRLGC